MHLKKMKKEMDQSVSAYDQVKMISDIEALQDKGGDLDD